MNFLTSNSRLIVIFIAGILLSALPNSTTNQKQVLEIQCNDEKPGVELLTKSVSIIENRLDDYGLKSYDAALDTIQNIIKISFKDEDNKNEIINLITSKGQFGFYESLDRKEVIKLLNKNDTLFSILSIPLDDQGLYISSATLGYCKAENMPKVESYNDAHYVSKPEQGIKFAWSAFPDYNGIYSLYLLKNDAAIENSFISESSVKENKRSMTFELDIVFNEAGTSLWQNLTKENIDKPIAIVLDNKVYSAPKVMQEITGGKCSITGNFTKNELLILSSLIQNGELPLNFLLKE